MNVKSLLPEKGVVSFSDDEDEAVNTTENPSVNTHSFHAPSSSSEDESEEDPELIVLEYIEEGEEGYFQNIDDEEEFDRVCEYIESLADEVEE